MSKEFGDFQTPPALVADVLQSLAVDKNLWSRVLEPTCGYGNFISGLLALAVPPREIQAIEFNEAHFKKVKEIAAQSLLTRVVIKRARLFDLNLQSLNWSVEGRLLIVGNPPWITNSQLSTLESKNLPIKTNLKGLRGIEAITGHSNFDISEYIWLKLIRELAQEQPTIALLCKTSVARNVLQFTFDNNIPVSNASIRTIDAQKWFGAAVSACFFRLDVGSGTACYEANIYSDLYTTTPDSTIGILGNKLVADVRTYKRFEFVEGVSSLTWRQGLKHDAASVMELTRNSQGVLQNKLGETVIAESAYIYLLLKGSDLFHGIKSLRSVIVTQKRVGEDTYQLQRVAPQLWCYLSDHASYFIKRKSSIYQGKPPFSIFGIGDYSFALYKVAISGLHKLPRFQAISPVDERPVMLDDTCYFIPCYSLEQATFLASLLNSPICLNFIQSRIFLDAKRPVTKKFLQCIDLKVILKHVELKSLLIQAEAEFFRLKTKLDKPTPDWSSLEKFLDSEVAE